MMLSGLVLCVVVLVVARVSILVFKNRVRVLCVIQCDVVCVMFDAVVCLVCALLCDAVWCVFVCACGVCCYE